MLQGLTVAFWSNINTIIITRLVLFYSPTYFSINKPNCSIYIYFNMTLVEIRTNADETKIRLRRNDCPVEIRQSFFRNRFLFSLAFVLIVGVVSNITAIQRHTVVKMYFCKCTVTAVDHCYGKLTSNYFSSLKI